MENFRFRFRRNFRLIARCLSDKPSDSDGKTPESKIKGTNIEKKEKKASESTEKIQSLLKMMLEKPKLSQQEYEEQFTVAAVKPRRRKQRDDEIEVKTERIGTCNLNILTYINNYYAYNIHFFKN